MISDTATSLPSHNMQLVDANDTVLPYVLRHSKLELGTLCRLICCSTSTANAVHACSLGSLKVQLPSHKALGRTRVSWLSKHAVLLGDLQHGNMYSNSSSAESFAAAKSMAGALKKAAALPGGLMLRSLSTCCLPVLKAASCSTITHLGLGLSKEMLFPSVQKTAACITGKVERPCLSCAIALKTRLLQRLRFCTRMRLRCVAQACKQLATA